MDAKLKAKWVKALRSGKYEQGQSALKRGNEFCCLGVLADVIGVEWQKSSGEKPYLNNLPIGSFTYLVDKFLSTGLQGDLVAQNDTGKSFAQIADYIEEHL